MNSTLYIIGNRFDRANGLQTSYNDFKGYLEAKYNAKMQGQRDHFVIKKGEKLAPDDYQNTMLLIKMIDSALKRVYHKKNDWSNFEDVLGKYNMKIFGEINRK